MLGWNQANNGGQKQPKTRAYWAGVVCGVIVAFFASPFIADVLREPVRAFTVEHWGAFTSWFLMLVFYPLIAVGSYFIAQLAVTDGIELLRQKVFGGGKF